MRVLLTSPFPRWSLLLAKLIAGVLVSVVQAYVFLAIAPGSGSVEAPPVGYLPALPAFIADGADARRDRPVPVLAGPPARELRQRDELRDLPDVLRLLGALSAVAHPRIQRDALPDLPRQPLHPRGRARRASPSTARSSRSAFAVVLGTTLVFFSAAALAYDPGRGIMVRRGGPQGEARMTRSIRPCLRRAARRCLAGRSAGPDAGPGAGAARSRLALRPAQGRDDQPRRRVDRAGPRRAGATGTRISRRRRWRRSSPRAARR